MQDPPSLPDPILVVDDDPAIRETIRSVLEWEGYRVETAANGADALALVEQSRPVVILLDLNMPVLDGWAFFQRLRAANMDVPVVFMTAGQTAHIEAARHGADGSLPKPFDLDDLYRVVERFVTPPAAP